jgi:hypothetical protein
MQTIDSLFNLLGTIVILAMITVVFASKNTQGIINSLANAFTNSIKAATQQK